MKPLSRHRIPDKEIVATSGRLSERETSIVRISARGWTVELDTYKMIRTNTPQFASDPSVIRGVEQRALNDRDFQLLVFRSPASVAGARIVSKPQSTYRRGLAVAVRRLRRRA